MCVKGEVCGVELGRGCEPDPKDDAIGEEEMNFQVDDLVRTPQGLFGEVESVGREFVKVRYERPSMLAMVKSFQFKPKELQLVKRGKEEWWEKVFHKIRREELREVVGQERAVRAEMPSEEEKKKRVVRRKMDLVGELTQEELEDVARWVREKREERR